MILQPTRKSVTSTSILLSKAMFVGISILSLAYISSVRAIKELEYGSEGKTIELGNDMIKFGVDPFKGCGIGLVQNMKESDNFNMVNTWDYGRWIQSSFYGKPEGNKWNGKDWPMNGVQVGSWQNKKSKVDTCEKVSDTVVEAVTYPADWAGNTVRNDMAINTRMELLQDSVKVSVEFKYTGTDGSPVKNQEIPAAFFDRKLSSLMLYDGDKPWTDDKIRTEYPKGIDSPFRSKITEPWAAYIDPNTGKGVGIFSPKATLITSYRVGPDENPAPSDCSYVAPLMNFALKNGESYDFEYYIAVGTIEEIRNIFKSKTGEAPQRTQRNSQDDSSTPKAQDAPAPAPAQRLCKRFRRKEH